MSPGPFRAGIMACQVDQFPADLGRGQSEEVRRRGRHGGPERPVQTDQGILKDVTRLLPPADSRVALEHLAGEPGEPVAGAVEQGRPGGVIALTEAVDVRSE